VRESPVIALIEHLIGKGREVRVFDPQIVLARIYGANRQYVVDALPHIGRLMVPSLQELIEWCDCAVVAQYPSHEVRAALAAARRPLLDLVGAFSGCPAKTRGGGRAVLVDRTR
jgi:GDP-mannose 6-dehydrogenase